MKHLSALLDATATAWAAVSADAIVKLWDRDAFRYYKAEEIAHFFHAWDDVVAYWRNNDTMHEAIRLEFTKVNEMPLDGHLRLVTFAMRWDIRFSGGAPSGLAHCAMGGDNHVLALVAQTDAGLRWAGWSETPDAAAIYVRRMYEAQARI